MSKLITGSPVPTVAIPLTEDVPLFIVGNPISSKTPSTTCISTVTFVVTFTEFVP